MKLVALEIPDDPALMPGWLESHLVNTDFAALVADLKAVHGEQPDNLSLTDDLPPGVYLERLADAAGEWFKKRPDDSGPFRSRISTAIGGRGSRRASLFYPDYG